MLIRADAALLASEGARVDACADTIDDEIARAEEHVEDVLAAGWIGGSADAFRDAFAHWHAAATAGAAELHRLATGIRETSVDVRSVEERHAELLRRIEAELSRSDSVSRVPAPTIPGLDQLMRGM